MKKHLIAAAGFLQPAAPIKREANKMLLLVLMWIKNSYWQN